MQGGRNQTGIGAQNLRSVLANIRLVGAFLRKIKILLYHRMFIMHRKVEDGIHRLAKTD